MKEVVLIGYVNNTFVLCSNESGNDKITFVNELDSSLTLEDINDIAEECQLKNPHSYVDVISSENPLNKEEHLLTTFKTKEELIEFCNSILEKINNINKNENEMKTNPQQSAPKSNPTIDNSEKKLTRAQWESLRTADKSASVLFGITHGILQTGADILQYAADRTADGEAIVRTKIGYTKLTKEEIVSQRKQTTKDFQNKVLNVPKRLTSMSVKSVNNLKSKTA